MDNLYNLHLEQIILGSILNNNDIYGKIFNKIHKELFYDLNHQVILQAIINSLQKVGVADYLIIRDSVINAHVKDEYLLEISKQNTHESNINEYLEMLHNLYKRRKAILIGEALSKKACTPDFSEADIHKFEEEIFSLLTNHQQIQTFSFEEGVNITLKHLNKMLEEKRHIAGLTSGFNQLDNILGGLQAGALIVIAGRTSMGKTAFATNVAVNTALSKEYGGAVVIFSLEMPHEQIVTRIIGSLSEISVSDLLYCKITEKEMAKCVMSLKKFLSIPLYIHDAADISIGEILTVLRNLKRKHNIRLVVIDYLQLISGGDNVHESRVNEIGKITRRLKLIAKELNICVIVLSQLSRSPEKREDPTPKLSDLRESGNIEQDADAVLFVHRDNYYNKDKSEENTDHTNNSDNHQAAKIIVGKNRNGRLGVVNLIYEEKYTKFVNV